MSTRVGTMLVELDLDNGKFVTKVHDASRILKRLERDLGDTKDAVKGLDHHFTSLGARFRNLAITVASLKYTFADFAGIVTTPTRAIMKASAEIERMTFLMAGLSKETDALKRKQEAASNVKFVFGMAKNAPFEVNALSDSFVKFKAAGLDPTNGSLKTLVDSVARFGGSSEHLKRASVAIQQMAGKGVISMEELRQQLGEAVPSAMQAMATGTGMTMGELVKQISKGTVEATSALERMFAVLKAQNDGAAAELMGSWVGQVEKLKTNWTLFLNTIGNSGGFFGAMKVHLEALNTFFESEEGERWAREIGASAKAVLDSVVAFAKFIKENWGLIEGFGKLLISIWAGSKIISAIGSLKSAYAAFVAKYVGGVKLFIAAEEAANKAKLAAAAQQIAADNAKLRSAELASAKRIAAERAEVVAKAKANAEKIALESRAAAAELNSLRTRKAAAAAEAASYRAKEMAAAQAEVAAVAKYGEYAGRVHAQRQREMRIAYGERAIAAELALKRINAAEANAMNVLHAHTARLRANTIAASQALSTLGTVGSASLTGITRNSNVASVSVHSLRTAGVTMATTVGAAATATAGKFAILRGAVGLLGGPIGIVTTLLSVGATAWLMWGNKADEATERAREGLEAVKNGYATLEQARAMSARAAKLEKEIAEKRSAIKDAEGNWNMTEAVKASRVKLAEMERELAEIRANVGEAHAQGSEAAISRTVSFIEQRSEREIAKMRVNLTQRMNDELNKLEESFKAKEVSEKEYAKRKSDITRQNAVAMAEQEVGYYRAQAKWIESKVKEIEDGKIKGLTTASDKYKAYVRQAQAMRAREQQAMAGLTSAGTIGTSPTILGDKGGADPGASQRPILEFMEGMRERIEGINSELNKKGEGTVAQLLESLKGNEFTQGKKKAMPAELEQAKALVEQYGELKNELKSRQEADGLLERANRMLESTKAKAEGGLGPVAAMRAEVEKLLGTTSNFDTTAKALDTLTVLDQLDAERARENADRSAKIALDYKEKATAIYRSLSSDKRAIMMEEVELEFQREQAKIQARKLSAENEKVELDALLEWKKARLAQAERDLETPMQRMVREWQDSTTAMQAATANWLNGATEAFVQFAMTGKLSFKDLAKSILEDIARIMMRKAIAGMVNMAIGAFSGGFGGSSASSYLSGNEYAAAVAKGGIFGGSVGGVKAFAKGGTFTNTVVSQPTMFKFAKGIGLMGEAGPEAVMPLTRGPDGKLGVVAQLQGGGAGGSNVQINITVESGGGEKSASAGEGAGAWKQMAGRIKGVVLEEIEKQKRPGGALYR